MQEMLFDGEESEEIFVLLSDCPRPEEIVGPPPAPALVESIRINGFEGALRLSRMPDGKLVIRGGRRRLKALWLLREEGARPFASASYTVPAYVRDWTGPEDALADITDNATVRPNHVGRFLALTQLAKSMSPETIAAKTGLHVGAVRQTLRLALLTPVLLEGFLHGDISYSAAQALAKMTRAQMGRAETALEENGELTVKQVQALRQAAADASLDEFFAQDALLDAPQQWPLVIDTAGGTATIVTPDGERKIISLDRFMQLIGGE